MKTKDFAHYLTDFLGHYLPELRNVSENTISSYCDTFRLFLGYCRDCEGMKIERFSLKDLTPELVERFLGWLETERKNSVSTRNQRLAAINSFAKYVQPQEPAMLLNFQRVLDIPIKKTVKKPIKPLSKEAVATILREPDTSTKQGRRDAVILCFLYDTAARVQELCDLKVGDVRIQNPASVRILGKGRKMRTVPLMPSTVQNLKNYLTENHLLVPEKSHFPLFANRDGNHFTPAGLRYILRKYVESASDREGILLERVTPHVIRHTKAMHTYEAGNNLIYVRDLLGHEDIKTTGVYAQASLKMKRQALEQVSDSPVQEIPSWVQNRDMLEWLKSFGAKK
ncbi:MAG TPA: integrase [Ruminiclostridium sp.]|jgi:site-specific recombinase XerD|nr:integrase [Ruminiclostridium sp.]